MGFSIVHSREGWRQRRAAITLTRGTARSPRRLGGNCDARLGGLGSLTEDCGNTFRNSGTPSASSSLAAFDAAATARIAVSGRAGARLGELLVDEGFVTPGEVKGALTEQRKTGRRLGEIIFECGLVSVPTLVTVLARQLEVELET